MVVVLAAEAVMVAMEELGTAARAAEAALKAREYVAAARQVRCVVGEVRALKGMLGADPEDAQPTLDPRAAAVPDDEPDGDDVELEDPRE
jgi:hypothetical protein